MSIAIRQATQADLPVLMELYTHLGNGKAEHADQRASDTFARVLLSQCHRQPNAWLATLWTDRECRDPQRRPTARVCLGGDAARCGVRVVGGLLQDDADDRQGREHSVL
jgi:hypothetical protein